MNDDDFNFVGPWSINVEWQQAWFCNSIPEEFLVFYTSPEAELRAIDEAFDENDIAEAQEMLKSIGVNIGDNS